MIEAPAGSSADSQLRHQVEQGFELLRQGRLEDASRLCAMLLAARPSSAQVLHLCSESRLAGGDPHSALDLIDAAMEAAPAQLTLLLRKAHILLALRRRNDARAVAEQAAQLASGNGESLWAVGKIHARCDDPVRAGQLYQQALDAGCRHPSLAYDRATTHFFTGDFERADRALQATLSLAPRHGHALYLRSILRRQNAQANHVADIEKRLRTGFDDGANRAAALYALAKELEDLGEHGKSFAVLTEAAATKRATLRYDAAAERAAIDGIRDTWTAEAMRTAAAGHDESGAIFVVGMPRTGTTLVERMLGRHADVGSAGELLDFGQALAEAVQKLASASPGISLHQASLQLDFARLGRDYMTSARQAAPARPLFIDKMPINFIYCGLIARALPAARIVHLVRDPMDSCYAVYKTLFNQAYHFSYDLAELADYYISYHRLMRHWHTLMPGRIIDVRYEDLVGNFDGEARRLVAACGLDWQDAVLAPDANAAPSTTASAAQVREPVHARSVQLWRRYERGLAPLRERLHAAGVLDD